MFDLLGFWFNVSVIVGVLLCPLFPAGAFIVNRFISRVTGDERLAEKYSERVFEWEGIDATIFGISVPFPVMVIFGIVCPISWLALFAAFVDHDMMLVESVTVASTTLAPYTGEVALLIVLYFGVEYLARKMWNVKAKVDSILEKGAS